MSRFDPAACNYASLAERESTLLVYEVDPDGSAKPFLMIDDEGQVFGFNGHVDLGTGIATSLAQIVAEELDVPISRVRMILGHTACTPDQGATIASDTIQTTSRPLRAAAAKARKYLSMRAAARLGVDPSTVRIMDGIFSADEINRGLGYGELVQGRRDRLKLARDIQTKDPGQYRLIGKSVPRVDIAPKATGAGVFVHDMRVPGMLHGRVIRPPYVGIDAGPFVGNSLIAVDEASIAHLPGIVAVVTKGDFVGVVAEREEVAIAAMEALHIQWRAVPGLRPMDDLADAISANPSTPRRLQDKGDVDCAQAGATARLSRTYVWPYQMHASIGPSCAIADWRANQLRIWSGTQNPYWLQRDLARLLATPAEAIEVVRMEAAGCYGRNCADDVAADAALLSRAVGHPVRVQLSREQEHLWEPKGTGQLMEVKGALDDDGDPLSYDFRTSYPSNGATTLALLLTGAAPATADVWEMGDRTSIAPYDIPNMRTTVNDMPPIVRASWLRGVSALPNSFAHESWIDEAAAMAGVDPVDYRLRFLADPRGVAVIEATAERADWQPHTAPQTLAPINGRLRGRGFAYALYIHSKFPGYGAAWAAWVADVSVDPATGEVFVDKVTVGHDAGLMINPDGVRHQIQGNVIQSTSRALKEQVSFDAGGIAASEWGSYPIITFPEVPEIDVLMLPRPDQPPLGVGESASVPSAAAIANALYDATGIRFREPPFTPEKVREALASAGLLQQPAESDVPAFPVQPLTRASGRRPPRRWRWAGWSGLAAGLLMALPWRGEIAPIRPLATSPYSAETIERGRMLAAVGDCGVCHAVAGGEANAGGVAFETPFGTVYSTNITPDEKTGIGAWSLAAFTRAMRDGISRDGRHLYPAFPYTSFAKVSDPDMESLYAYLMAQKPVGQAAPNSKLNFPYGFRPLMAGWNLLFHRPMAWRNDPAQSESWNRGAYLVEGLGHCAACHSSRNIFGAEKSGAAHMTGAMVDGWWAPSLTLSSTSPIPWREEDFYQYLRTGHSPLHGVAAGPMAPVVDELSQLPDADVRSMAHYLAWLQGGVATEKEQHERAALLKLRATKLRPNLQTRGARLFEGACASCHEPAAGFETFARTPALAVNSAVHASRPDNLIRLILEGVDSKIAQREGVMPPFRGRLTSGQIAEIVHYVRARYASDRPAWSAVEETVRSIR